jgi:hypothetical protein
MIKEEVRTFLSEGYMKRILGIIIILIALLPLIAADEHDTKVSTTIDLKPRYLFDINTKAVTADDDEIPSVVDKTTGIRMYYSDSFTITSVTGYYISYIFTENRSCTLSAQIKSDMIVKGGDSSLDTDKIPFTVEVKIDGNTTKTLSSSDKNTENLVNLPAATKVGDKNFGSLEITIKPENDSLKNKKVGFYTADIVLMVKEN